MIPEYISTPLKSRTSEIIRDHSELFMSEQGLLQIILFVAVFYIASIIANAIFSHSNAIASDQELDEYEITYGPKQKAPHAWYALIAIIIFLILRDPPLSYGGYIQNDLFVLDGIIILGAYFLSCICRSFSGFLKYIREVSIVVVWMAAAGLLFMGPKLLMIKSQNIIPSGIETPELSHLLLMVLAFAAAIEAFRNKERLLKFFGDVILRKKRQITIIAEFIDRLIVHQISIPDRINKRIATYQNKSEIYIALFQFLLIGLFMIVYMTVFSGFHDLIIPGVLFLYAFFVGHRLYLAETARLPQRVIILSIITDFAVLIAYIWSLHIQYDGAPVLSLKGQGILYMFVLMALRTLSFQPLYVLISGLCAAAGWGLLTLYAIKFHPLTTPILVEDFASSVSATQISMDIEMGKIGIILLVMTILILSQAMGRKILVESLQAQGNISDLSHFFDSNVVRKIISRKQDMIADLAETKHATIMFIDLRNFTNSSSNKAPQHVIQILKEYQALVVPIIEKHHGSIDKFMGDGILASFGAFDEGKTYARDALNTAHEIIAAHKKWASQPEVAKTGQANEIGMGIATGDLIVGVIGNQNRYEYTVIGDAVNRASKFEKQTKEEHAKMLCDDATYTCAKGQGYKKDLVAKKNVAVEGIAEKMDLWMIEHKPT